VKIAAGVEYDGTGFFGWQSQRGVRTVQNCIEAALSKVADHAINVICAGRTDTGVHAMGQVIHYETHALRSTRAWVLGANANLPGDVGLCWAQPVEPHFHARFSAISRCYRYVILNRWVRPAVLRTKLAWHHKPLDEQRMHVAGHRLLGKHDFSAFRALACQAKSPIRTIYGLNVQRYGDYIYIDICANGFLHHMVRNIVGVLMAIGNGKRPVAWVSELLESRDRTKGEVTAPSHGLYLVSVEYHPDFRLPSDYYPPTYA
jgi:tRNA pseudouridine38-40 synthase